MDCKEHSPPCYVKAHSNAPSVAGRERNHPGSAYLFLCTKWMESMSEVMQLSRLTQALYVRGLQYCSHSSLPWEATCPSFERQIALRMCVGDFALAISGEEVIAHPRAAVQMSPICSSKNCSKLPPVLLFHPTLLGHPSAVCLSSSALSLLSWLPASSFQPVEPSGLFLSFLSSCSPPDPQHLSLILHP